MNDNELRKLAIKSGKKINRDIYFNKKRRKELKKTFLKTQQTILKESDFSIKPVLKHEYAKRILDTSFLAFTVKGLEIIKKAERFDKTVYLTKCKFTLYRKGKSLVFKATFLKSLLDNKKRTSYFHFPQGLPKNTKKKTFIYKDGKKFGLKGYKLEDSGTIRQKILNFYELTLIYKGNKATYKFKLKLINEEKQSYWAIKLEN